MDVQQLFKALGVKMEGGEYDFSEKLAQYMKLMSELMGKKVLVFINIRSYLENEQIQELIKMLYIMKFHYYLLKIYKETFQK